MRKTVGWRFQEMSRLYHFTSFDSACKIIKSGKLRFSKAWRLNDLTESNRVVGERTISERLLVNRPYLLNAEAEMRKYQQISFAQDRECNGMEYLGFDLHSMWGLYADKGYGVCLVFDKDKLKLSEGDYASNVSYANFIPQGVIIKNKSLPGIKSEIWRKKDEIFFYKRKEWEYEQEYRIIRRAKKEFDTEYLDVSDSLSFVIICKCASVCLLGSMFDSDIYHELHHLNKKLPIFTYECGLDGYTLYEKWMVPVWSEQCGYM
jgi:hypothetical protein